MPNPNDTQRPRTFTGRQRRRRTSRAVVIADYAARICVHLGGYGTIAAVLVMGGFFLSVVAPLFSGGEAEAIDGPRLAVADERPLAMGCDEYQRLGWAIRPSGRIEIFDLQRGATVQAFELGDGVRRLSAASFVERGTDFALGFDDGSIQLGKLEFETRFEARDAFGGRFAGLEPGAGTVGTWREPRPDAPEADGVERRGWIEADQHRSLRVLVAKLELREAKKLGDGAVTGIDHAQRASGGFAIAVLLQSPGAPRCAVVTATLKTNLTSGAEELRYGRVLTVERPLEHASEAVRAVHLFGQGTSVLTVHESGLALRHRLEPGKEPRFVEAVDLAPEKDERVACTGFLLGGETLLVGGSGGRVAGWFVAPVDPASAGFEALEHDGQSWLFRAGSPELAEFRRVGERERFVEREGASLTGGVLRAPDEATLEAWLALRPADGAHLVAAKRYREHGAGGAIVALAPSGRGRVFALADASGAIEVVHGTSEKRIALLDQTEGETIWGLALAPKENGILALSAKGLQRWSLDPGYAAVTFATLFRPVWYESYPAPVHMWQSSAGEDSSEPKLGLWPLVFGTLKATFYSMLFGVPLALLAAIFTSEFLSARARSRVKPTIELMASLPSVVLGFLAALVFAPFVEQHLAGIFATIFALPLCLLLGAFTWQMLPRDTAARHAGKRLPLMALVSLPLAVGCGLLALGPILDSWLFSGSLRHWLDGARQIPIHGSPFGGWLLFFLPITALLVAYLAGWLPRRASASASHRAQATRSLLRFAVGFAVSAGLAVALAAFVSTFADLRGPGSVLDTYVQRNALVVGFVMGFAIVPIVYTIAEDALSSVPGHLRGASLGAGATPWQTAVRIVIPTAMSGLFSACMIGLGRAVGETMIILMAAGGTALLEVNLFNGFRTLAANLATELPEAVQGSAHYRTLFFAALVLFAMTFVLNSIAESVRQRFRRRAFEL